MPWVKPDDVTSPRGRWALTEVLYDAGPGEPAAAYGKWDGQDAVVSRWNGTDDPGKSLGNPQSTGHATWFVLPESIADATLRILLEKQAAGDPAVRRAALANVVKVFLFSPGL